MRKTLLAVLLAAAIAAVAAGCGGDDDDDETATTATTGASGGALTKDAFVTAADGVCAQGDKQIDQAAQQEFGGGGEPSTAEQERFFTDTVLPNIQNQIDGIRALAPPEGDEEQVTTILDAAQDAIDESEQDPSVITGGGEDPFAEANRLAEEYGLKDCGGG
ncbi:MAG: hypothetical protein ACRDSN_11400 [Pseudonocardiaceae bacterium]